jgi:hypothetical protein
MIQNSKTDDRKSERTMAQRLRKPRIRIQDLLVPSRYLLHNLHIMMALLHSSVPLSSQDMCLGVAALGRMMTVMSLVVLFKSFVMVVRGGMVEWRM